MSDNKVNEMLSQAAENFKGMIDANSVIGEAVEAGDGTIIVPISKVSFGFGGGGCEFDGKNTKDERLVDKNFGGGMGGGASVKAEAFLVINNGNVRLISMGGESSPLDKIVDLMPGVIDKVNNFIGKRKENKAKKEAQKKETLSDVALGE